MKKTKKTKNAKKVVTAKKAKANSFLKLGPVMVEIVKERLGPYVIASEIRKPKRGEIAAARKKYAKSRRCNHKTDTLYVQDEPGWIYDLRFCAICGGGLGTV